MKKIEHIFAYKEFVFDELDNSYKKLVDYAKEMMVLAYAPYSNFKVGASVLLDDGKLIGGNNQENIAYPSSMCAERIAIYSANSQYPSTKIIALAIFSQKKDKIISPCGACRQVMSELIKKQGKDFDVIMASNNKIIIAKSKDLIPFMFEY